MTCYNNVIFFSKKSFFFFIYLKYQNLNNLNMHNIYFSLFFNQKFEKTCGNKLNIFIYYNKLFLD